MFSSLGFGKSITDTPKGISVKGISAKQLVRDIDKHWKSSKISTHMFSYVGWKELRFNRFFAVEFVYILEQLKQYRNRWTSLKDINQLITLMNTETWLKNHNKDQTSKGRLDFSRLKNIVDRFKPEDYQTAYFNDYNVRLDRYNLRGDLIAAAPGTGKALRLSTVIKVPNGWTRMGDIVVGDIVVTPDGSTAKVKGVYPQGIKQLAQLTTEDGRIGEGCLEHLWKVCVNEEWVVIDTQVILDLLEQGNTEVYLPLTKPTSNRALLEELLISYGIPISGTYTHTLKLEQNLNLIKQSVWGLGGIVKVVGNKLEIDFTKDRLLITQGVKVDSDECQCIEVDHPDRLFVIKDYLVTHNTYMTSAIAEMLGAELIVVVVPKEVLDTVWEEEIEAMFREPQTVITSFNQREQYTGQRWILCHYNAMEWLINLLKDPKTVGNKKTCLILDESHNFNDPNSLRTKYFREVVNLLKSDNNILSSGTPVKAIGAELVNMLWVIDPLFDADAEMRFKKMFGKDAKKGQDIARHRMGIISHKIEKSVLGQEPPIMRDYPIKIPNGLEFTLPEIKKDMEAFIKERWVYYKARRSEDEKFWKEILKIHEATLVNRIQEQAFSEYLKTVKMISKLSDYRTVSEEIKFTNHYEKTVIEPTLSRDLIKRFRDVKSVIKYTSLKIQGECLGRVLGGKRTAAHVAMVPYIDWLGIVESTEKKTLTFTSFVPVVEASEKHCISLGLKPITVYGKTKDELAATVTRFGSDPKLNPLNATYASLSTGVRLTMADTILLINSPFRSYILDQAISRAHRKGQDSQVVVYKAMLDTGDIPNISTRSADILKWSTDAVAAIMGTSAPFQVGDTFESAGVEAHEQGIFDDNVIMYNYLNSQYSSLGITLSKEEFFIEPSVDAVNNKLPSYLR